MVFLSGWSNRYMYNCIQSLLNQNRVKLNLHSTHIYVVNKAIRIKTIHLYSIYIQRARCIVFAPIHIIAPVCSRRNRLELLWFSSQFPLVVDRCLITWLVRHKVIRKNSIPVRVSLKYGGEIVIQFKIIADARVNYSVHFKHRSDARQIQTNWFYLQANNPVRAYNDAYTTITVVSKLKRNKHTMKWIIYDGDYIFDAKLKINRINYPIWNSAAYTTCYRCRCGCCRCCCRCCCCKRNT